MNKDIDVGTGQLPLDLAYHPAGLATCGVDGGAHPKSPIHPRLELVRSNAAPYGDSSMDSATKLAVRLLAKVRQF